MLRKNLFYIIIFLVIVSGCSETSIGGRSAYTKEPVDITTVSRGEIINGMEALDIEYSIEDEGIFLNRLEIQVLDGHEELVIETVIEETPLSGYVPEIFFEEQLIPGRYFIKMSFFSDDELYHEEQREFFVSTDNYYIKSITSYPPVLYPGGGGIFYADTECSSSDCWLRWSLDGTEIASGMSTDGFQSIIIDSPGNEGVYDLSLEVFPLAPEAPDGYDYESTIIKSIPVYVNTNQKAGANEFGPEEDFYALFHFRGNLVGTSSVEDSGIDTLSSIGNPELSVRNGILGYYLDRSSGFETMNGVVPISDGKLQSFSVMFSVIPGGAVEYNELELPYSVESGSIFYSGIQDGGFYLSIDSLFDGRLTATLNLKGEKYVIRSEEQVLFDGVYSSFSLAIYPEGDNLNLLLYQDGIPIAEKYFIADPDLGRQPWQDIEINDSTWLTRFAGDGGFEGLVDEFGIYYVDKNKGLSVDPEQYRRSMELEYGKSLIYAEGFDGQPEDMIIDEKSAVVEGSVLSVKPGGVAEFPAFYPGYEEITFSIVLSDSSTKTFEIVFNPEESEEDIIKVDLSAPGNEDAPVDFSMFFSTEVVTLSVPGVEEDVAGTAGDFSGVVYRLINNSENTDLEIESVLVVRKNVKFSEAGTTVQSGMTNLRKNAGTNIGS